jgi:uncharacterized protein
MNIRIINVKGLLLLLFFAQNLLAQYNPQKPDLCQGKYFTEEEGVKFHEELIQKTPDSLAWEKRKALVYQGILDGAELNNRLATVPLKPIIRGLTKLDGYTIENVAFESLEGFYVTANLYRPLNMKGKKAGIICTHGHSATLEGRFLETMQQRCATLARMGAIVLAIDMVGYSESKQCEHKIPKVFKLQAINTMRAVDFLVSLPDVDANRIAVTGESGGGTQAFMLTALDKRIKISVPVVMVSEYFFGGCVCESGMPVHKRPSSQTSNTEIAALAAPRPMLLISDGNDWTKNTESNEYPFIQRIYGFYGAKDRVENAHFANEKHDYGKNKRQAAYRFLAKHLKLSSEKVLKDGIFDETPNTILKDTALKVFDEQHPRPQNAVMGNEAIMGLL